MHVRIDFSLATRLSRASQQVASPDTLAGTIAYMAPEQTGRMNRVVDMRSDLARSHGQRRRSSCHPGRQTRDCWLTAMQLLTWPSSVGPHGLVLTVRHICPEGQAASQRV